MVLVKPKIPAEKVPFLLVHFLWASKENEQYRFVMGLSQCTEICPINFCTVVTGDLIITEINLTNFSSSKGFQLETINSAFLVAYHKVYKPAG